jgi:mono/diheme cytochrome c family protein
MKKYIVFVFFALVIFACGSGEQSSDRKMKKRVEKVVDGAKIYKRYCVSCHGIYGNMGTSGAFDLTKSVLSIEEKMVVITNGRKLMTAFKSTLSEEEIRAVATYTESFKTDK